MPVPFLLRHGEMQSFQNEILSAVDRDVEVGVVNALVDELSADGYIVEVPEGKDLRTLADEGHYGFLHCIIRDGGTVAYAFGHGVAEELYRVADHIVSDTMVLPTTRTGTWRPQLHFHFPLAARRHILPMLLVELRLNKSVALPRLDRLTWRHILSFSRPSDWPAELVNGSRVVGAAMTAEYFCFIAKGIN